MCNRNDLILHVACARSRNGRCAVKERKALPSCGRRDSRVGEKRADQAWAWAWLVWLLAFLWADLPVRGSKF